MWLNFYVQNKKARKRKEKKTVFDVVRKGKQWEGQTT